MLRFYLFLFICLGFAVSCGGGKSCELSDLCVEYSGSSYTEERVSELCSAASGSVDDSCPTEDRVGICTTGVGSNTEIKRHYYSGAVSENQQICSNLGGVWSSG